MIVRTFSLIPAAALAAASIPASAHEDRFPAGVPIAGEPAAGTWQGEWAGEWEGENSYIGVWQGTFTGLDGEQTRGEYRGRFIGDSRFVSHDGRTLYREGERGWREYDRRYAGGPPPVKGGPQFGYSSHQRDAWLDQCRSAYDSARYYDGRYGDGSGRRRGAAIGGVLGAAAGGLVGNRIADRSRLAGTVIGAGVGAVAGAAIGSAVGEGADRRRYQTFDECEDYLVRYESSHGGGYGAAHGYGYPYAPVMWVRVPIMRSRDCGCEEVIEEVVEEVVSRPAPIKRTRVVQQPVKRVPIKQIKYAK